MSFSLSGAINGAAVSGLTTPTHTWTQDSVTPPNMKQYVCTQVGGTQTDVSTHSVASPFLVSLTKPSVFKPLSMVNPVTGRLTSVPRNTWKMIFIKGATPLAGQASVPILIRVEFVVPSGVDSADPNEIRSLLSAMGGVLWNQAGGLADSFLLGII